MVVDSHTPSLLELASFRDKQAAPEPQEIVPMPQKSSLDFDTDNTDNPRTWTPKKKAMIGLFVLLSAFVA